MNPQKQVLLNRAVFSQRDFDSGALTVLTTFLHHFPEPGDYNITVRSAGQRDRRLSMHVQAEGAPSQINIDLAALDKPDGEPGCCPGEADYKLQTNGVAGFYASQGTGAYSLLIKRSDEREKKVLLDSADQIPAGDLFAVTLVRPGVYRAANLLGHKFNTTIQVEMPPVPNNKPDKDPRQMKSAVSASPRYRPDQPVLVTLDQKGFHEKKVSLFAGQSVVFFCQIPAHLRVELEQEKEVPEQPELKTFRSKRQGRGK